MYTKRTLPLQIVMPVTIHKNWNKHKNKIREKRSLCIILHCVCLFVLYICSFVYMFVWNGEWRNMYDGPFVFKVINFKILTLLTDIFFVFLVNWTYEEGKTTTTCIHSAIEKRNNTPNRQCEYPLIQ